MTKTAKAKKSGGHSAGQHSPVVEEVRKLYEFMQKNQLETIDYQQDGTHLRLVRSRPGQVPMPVFSNAAPAANVHQKSIPTIAANQPQKYSGDSIKSPLMGIFFRAPTPASPPFAREGERVKSGQVICLIEAMKVFNEVKAEFDCVISKVLVENGKPVKPGQDLFAIERV